MTIEVDPISSASPDLAPTAVVALRESIQRIGQQVPIVLWRGRVIDGRKRLAACQALNREPLVVTIPDSSNAPDFATALNLLRTHYTTGQKAIYSAKLATLSGGRPKKTDSNEEVLETASTNELGGKPLTRGEAAELTGSSMSSVGRAKQVLEHASPEVIAAVEAGDMGISDAMRSFTPPNMTSSWKKTKPRNPHSGNIHQSPAKLERALTALETYSEGLAKLPASPLPGVEKRLTQVIRTLVRWRKKLKKGVNP